MAAETPTTICNLALARIGVPPLSDLDTDMSKEAQDCRTLFHPARRKALTAHYWNHAKRAAQLTRDDTVTPTFWAYAFTLPTDYLRMITVHPSDDPNATCQYALQNQSGKGNMLVSDSNQIYIQYVFDNADLTLASEGFRDVLSFVLARDLCGALSKSATEAGLTDTAYRRTLTWAKSIDGMEDSMERLSEGSWTKARSGLYTDKSVTGS